MFATSSLNSFSNLNILIIGDVMIDAYFFGSVDRISPEAPVSIISVSKKDHRPGGAANVALNIKSLGANPILCSIIGTDNEGLELITLLLNEGLSTDGLFSDATRPTTIKTRVISNDTHLLRIDHESVKPISKDFENKIIAFITDSLSTINAIILEDYNKGVLTERLITSVIKLANENNIPTIVDPKNDNFLAYKNCTLFKPNRKEIKEGLKTELDLTNFDNINDAASSLMEILGCKNIMVTLSEDGVISKSQSETFHIKAHERNIVDVSGAGDTMVSLAALCLASGMDIEETTKIANIAGGLVCQKVGVVPIDYSELDSEIKRLNF